MLGNLVRKCLGSRNDRLLKTLRKTVDKINAFESAIEQLSDNELKSKTSEFKLRFKNGETLDNILPEAFAVVREAAKRTLGLRPYDVQLIGGMVLHSGKISEMRTGEGKTLVATLPAYLNAISGKGVHIITVNDYLANRDANWMAPIYNMLGLTVGVIVHGMEKDAKQAAYNADITYGTNNEFGFDYLRDNMAFSIEDKMQRELNFAIVDEVDSILIDEARTPLIISGAAEDSSELYTKINKLIPKLALQESEDSEPGDYTVDLKSKQAYLTETGHETIEELLIKDGLLEEGDSLYNAKNIGLMHHVYAGLRAHNLFKRDVDYVVANNEVVIVDEHTGRTMPGRRWSDGLHQAVEAKEAVNIQSENQTLASITFQNYFRLYNKLAGMTGTADTEAFEFQQIYGLEVVVIPTNKPNQRDDKGDLIYMTAEEKFEAIIADVEDCISRKQPVLVGTVSIETSEFLSKLLSKRKIKHNVLNAKFHEQEAQIIAEAGRPGAVTIATNMAGRGTDIVLGGNLDAEVAKLDEKAADFEIKKAELKKEWDERHAQVLEAGGLHIIGTERHESRRIDNQLRGRSGRQGDPGSTRFYLSIQDNLMRIFITDTVSKILNRFRLEHGEAITHPMVTRAVENAQRKVEGHNFDIRKQLLDFDNVANDQRKVVYQQRNELMQESDISATIKEMRDEVLTELVAEYIPPNSIEEEWDIDGLMSCLRLEFGQDLDIKTWLKEDETLHEESLKEKLLNIFDKLHQDKEAIAGNDNMRYLEKTIMLNTLDTSWKEHLATMDYTRQSIHLRGYAQKDPKQEYKREAFTLFTSMLSSIRRSVISTLALIEIKQDDNYEGLEESHHEPTNMNFVHDEAKTINSPIQDVPPDSADGTFVRDEPKVGRNQLCTCGSGKKYKHCCGRI